MIKKLISCMACLLVLCTTSNAQDYIKNLEYNPVLVKKSNPFTQKNTPFDSCVDGLPFLNIALNDTIAPTFGDSDGAFIVDINSNLDQVDFFVDGTFFASTNGESTITINQLPVGVYTIQAIGEYGLNDELFLGLSNNELVGLGAETFDTRTEFCEEGGKIVKVNAFVAEGIQYDIKDLEGNFYTSFGFGADSIEVPAGKYYAYYFDADGDFEQFYWPIEVPIEIPATIPFFDDFSDTDVYPNSNNWKDSTAYINQTFAYAPPSIGVATLDGLDASGLPYTSTDTPTDGFADKFHSNRFCMDDVSPADSLYLSFYYQGRGNGDYPNANDSLIVEFLNADNEWVQQWATNFEFNETDLVANSAFQQVSIPITDTLYFFKGFQFRFLNKATLNGQNDHWHIDYVELKRHLNGFDPNESDVTFLYPAPSILKNYSAMPYYQFEGYESQELVENLELIVRNNRGVSENIEHSFDALDVCTNQTTYTTTDQLFLPNIAPGQEIIINFSPNGIPDLIPQEPEENIVLDITYNINGEGNDERFSNNVVKHRQFFSNYLAYDDGSPEKAIGYQQNGAQVAQKYFINKPDTLIGLMIYFTHIIEDVSDNEFYLMAWDSINTSTNLALKDQVIAKTLSTKNPIYTDELTQFTVYTYDEPVAVADSFYVGYQQMFDNNLSVGFDVFQPYLVNNQQYQYSKTARLNTFFNDQAVWENSIYEGCAMIRPILSSSQQFYPTNNNELDNKKNTVTVYPNPATNLLNIDYQSDKSMDIAIFNVEGKLVKQLRQLNDRTIDISQLNKGLYLLQIQADSEVYTTKFLKE